MLLAGAALAITSSPASAHTDVCVGQGTATTSPLYYPGVGPSSNGAFALNTPAATTVCVLNTTNTITAAGTFGPGPVAYCGHSTGTGTVNGHDMTYVSAASILVIAGLDELVVGVANAIPDALNGQSCLTGAQQFIVTGVVTFGPHPLP